MYVYSRRTGLYCGKFRSYRTQYLGFCFLVWLVIVQAKAVKWSLGWWGPEGLDSYREVCRTGPILCSHPSLFLISDLLPHLSFIFFTQIFSPAFHRSICAGFCLPGLSPSWYLAPKWSNAVLLSSITSPRARRKQSRAPYLEGIRHNQSVHERVPKEEPNSYHNSLIILLSREWSDDRISERISGRKCWSCVG